MKRREFLRNLLITAAVIYGGTFQRKLETVYENEMEGFEVNITATATSVDNIQGDIGMNVTYSDGSKKTFNVPITEGYTSKIIN